MRAVAVRTALAIITLSAALYTLGAIGRGDLWGIGVGGFFAVGFGHRFLFWRPGVKKGCSWCERRSSLFGRKLKTCPCHGARLCNDACYALAHGDPIATSAQWYVNRRGNKDEWRPLPAATLARLNLTE
jgi:hypothetical protein